MTAPDCQTTLVRVAPLQLDSGRADVLPTEHRHMKHVMIDIETLGIQPPCGVLSIGAVEFGPTGLGREMYVPIRVDEKSSVVVNTKTLMWWMQQSQKAQWVFNDPNAVTQRDALLQLNRFWNVSEPGGDPNDGCTYVWCHGAGFDVPILEYAYGRERMTAPWHFSKVRDTRTLYAMAGVRPERDDDHHNALADARAQAVAAVAALDKLGAWF